MSESGQLRWRPLWLALGWVLAAVILALSLMSGPPQPIWFAHADKLEHALAFFLLTAWFIQLYRGPRRWAHAALFTLFGVAIEFLQGAGGIRHFEIADMIADVTGIGLALVAGRVPGFDRLLVRFERLLVRSGTR